MPNIEELLKPIPGANPSGADLFDDPVFEKIKEARRTDTGGALDMEDAKAKVADYAVVAKLASDALANRSKDLRIAAWLTEAWLNREGYGSLRSGLDLLRGLLERFWDTLYPEIEEGDAGARAGPLGFVGEKLQLATQSVPLSRSGHSYLQYISARTLGYEGEVANDATRAAARTAAIEEGKLVPEQFDDGFTATPKAWYKQLAADIRGSLESLHTLDKVAGEKFADDPPSFRGLEAKLLEVQRTVASLLTKKLELEPDPPELEEAEPGPGATPDGPLTPEPTSREDAANRVGVAARYLRRDNPRNPAPYLMLRGLRWGELRSNDALDPKLLSAPPTAVRSQIKGLLLDGRWRDLLETAESVMGAAHGRGWLDLQRYVLTACAQLGGEYDGVAFAVRGALAELLRARPELLEMTLMDDTPTANTETQAWLKEEGLVVTPPANGEGETPIAAEALPVVDGDGNGAAADRGPMRSMPSRNVYDRALDMARSEGPQRAIALLAGELARERSPRARFIRRTQIAKIMVDAGMDAIAKPILMQLAEQIETHKLEEWEEGSMVAQPLALLYRCLTNLNAEDVDPQAFYLRVCRLDPMQAIEVGQR